MNAFPLPFAGSFASPSSGGSLSLDAPAIMQIWDNLVINPSHPQKSGFCTRRTGRTDVTFHPQHRWCRLADSEEDYLLQLKEAGICPNCGNPTMDGRRVVRGEGIFCSLDCVASYYAAEFSERARRLAAAARH